MGEEGGRRREKQEGGGGGRNTSSQWLQSVGRQNQEGALSLSPLPTTHGRHYSIFTRFPRTPGHLPASQARSPRGLDTVLQRAGEEGQKGWLLHSHGEPGRKENQRQPVTREKAKPESGGRRSHNAQESEGS